MYIRTNVYILGDAKGQNSILELGSNRFKEQILLSGLDGISFNNETTPFAITGLGDLTGYMEIYTTNGTLLVGNLTDFVWNGTEADGVSIAPAGNYRYKITINQDPDPAIEISGDLIKNWE